MILVTYLETNYIIFEIILVTNNFKLIN